MQDEKRQSLLDALVVSVLALVVRLSLLFHFKVVETDGAYYGATARFFAGGHWSKALDPSWPPLYPFLVGLLHRAGFSLEAAGLTVSILAGALFVVPCYHIGRLVGGRGVGLAAAVIAALHPRLLYISQSYLAESVFILFSATSLALFLGAVGPVDRGVGAGCAGEAGSASRPPGDGPRWTLRLFMIGFTASLAFLARPEGFAYFVLMASIFTVLAVTGRRLPALGAAGARARGVVLLAAMLAGFLLPAFPYLYNVHGIEGRWTVGEKAGWSFYLTYAKEYKEEGIAIEASDFASITSPETPRKPGRYHVLEFLRRRPGLVALHTLGNIPRALFSKIPGLFYWPFFLLALFGAFAGARARGSRCLWILGLWILLSVVMISPLFLFRRYFSVTLAPLIALAAVGAEETRRAVPPRRFRAAALILAVALVAYTHVHLSASAPAVLYKRAGLWLEQNPAQAGKVVLTGRKPEAAFYAGGEYRPLRAATPAELQAFIEREGVTHVLVDDYVMTKSHPGLAVLLDPANAPPWLEKVFSASEGGHNLVLYRYKR